MALGVGEQAPPGRVERGAVADAGEHVEQRPAGGRGVAHVVGGDDGHAARGGEIGEAAGEPLPGALEMAVHVDGETIAEDALQPIEVEGRLRSHQRPLRAAGEAVQPGGMLLELLPGRQGIALGTARRRGGEQAAEIRVAGAVLDQEGQDARIRDDDLRSHQGAHAGTARGGEEARRSVDAVTIAQGEGVVAECRRPLDQILRQGGAAQEAEGAPAAQLDVAGGGHLRLCFASWRHSRQDPVPSPPQPWDQAVVTCSIHHAGAADSSVSMLL